MDSLAQLGAPGVALVAGAAVLCVVLCVVLAVVVVRLVRGSRARRARLDAQLADARAEVEALSRRVEELSGEVVETRREAEQDREYVITSMGEVDVLGARLQRAPEAVERALLRPARPSVGKVLEEQLVGALARRQDQSAVRDRAVDLVVRTVALGHGVRRALAPDVRDRAAAESNVARRRSRRIRKREVREARRLLRAVKVQQPAGEDAA